MFAGAFHGGPSVEVFTAQGSAPLKDWKVAGKPKKLYDKQVKSFIFDLDGMTKMQVPKDERGSLALTQGFLALQVKIPPSKGFAVEIALMDTTRKRRRIVCNAGNKETVATALHARVPMGPIRRGVWLNLCFDVRDMTSRLWPGTEFQSMELISVGAACKLRRIATLRGALVDTTEDDVKLGCDRTIWQSTPIEEAPKSWQFLPGVQHVNQIFHMHKLYAWEAASRGETYTPAGHQTAEAIERLGAVSPAQAKFPAAREEPAPSPSGAQVAFGRRIEQAGAGGPPGTAGSRAQTAGSRLKTPGTAGSRLKTPGGKGTARGGTAGTSGRSPSRVDSGLASAGGARTGTAASQRSGRTSAKARSPMREVRQQRKQLSGLDARADARRQEAASRGAVEDVMGVLAKKDAQIAAMEAEIANERGGGGGGGGVLPGSPAPPPPDHQLGEEMEIRSPLGSGWAGSPRSDEPTAPEPEPEPRAKPKPKPNDRKHAGGGGGRGGAGAGAGAAGAGVRQSAQLRQQEIEKKRAHLARLEESYIARFGGPALGPHSGQQQQQQLASYGAAADSPVPSHAGSVAEELVEYADSMGTGGGYDEEDDRGAGGMHNMMPQQQQQQQHYGQQHGAADYSDGASNQYRAGYDRNRYSDEIDEGGGRGDSTTSVSLRGGAGGAGGGNFATTTGGLLGGSSTGGIGSPRSPMRASKIGFADDDDSVRLEGSHFLFLVLEFTGVRDAIHGAWAGQSRVDPQH